MPLREFEAERELADSLAERRLTTRIAVNWPAKVDLADGTQRAIRVRNVSLGGARVESEKPLGLAVEAHTEVVIDGDSVTLDWVVAPVWAHRNGNGTFLTGLRFHGLPPEEYHKLKTVIGHYLDTAAGAEAVN